MADDGSTMSSWGWSLLTSIFGSLPVANPIGLPVFLSQIPLVIYFVASLQDLPMDVALVRFVTSYTIPLLLWITFTSVRV